MKYIKEYSEYDSKQFTPEDVEELKDVYQDIVDDLGLYDNPFRGQLQILKVDDSTFQLPNKYEGKMCKIFIRTIVTEMWHFGEMKEVYYYSKRYVSSFHKNRLFEYRWY